MIMRAICAALVATSLMSSSVFAATAAPLPAGKPAGAKQAALLGPNGLLVLFGLGVVIGGVVLTVSGGDKTGVTTPTTTGTP
jgi:hypothetical protein